MTMRSQYLKDKFGIIRDNFKKAKSISKSDPKIASMMSSYLVVFISGIYEDCIEHLFIERAGKNKDIEIKNLVKVLIDQQFRNPNYKNIKKLVGALDPKYDGILRKEIVDKNINGIDSIVNNKNKIAHGESSNATLNDIITYHKDALKIFGELEKIPL